MSKLCELTRLRDGPLDLVGGGVFFLKKTMHKDNVRKKHASAYRFRKNTCKGMRLIYIIYVNLGKTGFVFEHSLY